METVFLYNTPTDTYIEIQLSKEDIQRFENDAVFAQHIMAKYTTSVPLDPRDRPSENVAVHENATIESVAPSDRPIASTPTPFEVLEEDENVEIHNSDENEETGCIRWSAATILLLLDTYSKFEKKMESGQKTKKKVWEEIAASMSKQALGTDYTGEQCAAKLRSLKKRYKSVKDHNGKSGNSRKHWEFFKNMDDLFGKKAWSSPVATASSTGLAIMNTEVKSKASTSKRSLAALLEERIRQKEEHEAKKAKRHEERQAMDKNMFDLFTKIIEKL